MNMSKRLELIAIPTFMGNCYLITDTQTGKNIEIMSMQLKSIMATNKDSGSLPHGGWEKEGDKITIYHDEDREGHEVTFTLNELTTSV